MTNPHRTDFHHVDVPRPIDVNGKRSPRRTKMSKTIALTQMSDSLQSAPVKVVAGQKCETVCRITSMANNAISRPIHVTDDIRALTPGCSLTLYRMQPQAGLDSRLFGLCLLSSVLCPLSSDF